VRRIRSGIRTAGTRVTTIGATLATMMISSAMLAPTLHAQAAKPPAARDTTPMLTSTALPGRQSWLSDRRDFHLGDIVTILVDEYTLTSLDKQVNATDSRRRSLGFGLSTPSGNKDFDITSNNDAESQNHGLDARTNRLTTEMSARVVAIAPNGLMQLKGTKGILVEQSKVHLMLTGWVRVQDVSAQNIVQSFRMADADLDYEAEGPLGKAKSGIIGRLLGAFWP
jgi:flagellar L-ring protein precursor FlgH